MFRLLRRLSVLSTHYIVSILIISIIVGVRDKSRRRVSCSYKKKGEAVIIGQPIPCQKSR
jgi:hypothetical protein